MKELSSAKFFLNQLDELLFWYTPLSHIACASVVTRMQGNFVFKAMADISRFANASLQTREQAWYLLTRHNDPVIKQWAQRLVDWRSHHFSARHENASLRVQAWEYSYQTLETFGKQWQKLAIVPFVSDVKAVHSRAPVEHEPTPRIQKGLEFFGQVATGAITGIWSSYFADVVFLQPNLAAATRLEVLRHFSVPHSKPLLLLPQELAEPLFTSSYLLNPFKAFDAQEEFHTLAPPPVSDSLLRILVKEVLSQIPLYVRLDLGRACVKDLYRLLLKLQRLEIYLTRGEVILPYEDTFRYYLENVDSANWMQDLERVAVSSAILSPEIFQTYYPSLKRMLDNARSKS